MDAEEELGEIGSKLDRGRGREKQQPQKRDEQAPEGEGPAEVAGPGFPQSSVKSEINLEAQ